MRERILLEGPQGCGKTHQILNVATWLAEYDIPMYIMDLEDKFEAMLTGRKDPGNITLYAPLEWDDDDRGLDTVWGATEDIMPKVNPGDWIGVDRVDLWWPMVQRWYSRGKYNEELAERMMTRSKAMGRSMFTPRFDQGAWQVVNEQYDSILTRLLYRSRCNIILTTGIKKPREDESPLDIGRLGVLPRGQKEIGHQPHSLFLLGQRKERGDFIFTISTDKDLPGRVYFNDDSLDNLALEYLALYYDPEERPALTKRRR